jgi:hypothetical protein
LKKKHEEIHSQIVPNISFDEYLTNIGCTDATNLPVIPKVILNTPEKKKKKIQYNSNARAKTFK